MTQPIHDSWTIARSALLTHQHRLAVTANNIANIDTPGYSRRTVQLSTVPETPPTLTDMRGWSHGNGVQVANVVRSHNEMLHNLLRDQLGETAAHDTRAQALGTLESLMREDGDSALSAKLDGFWNAWYDLSNQADNMGFRSVVVQRGVELAEHFRSLDERISDFETQILRGTPGDFSGVIAGDVEHFNQLTQELQDLNSKITYGGTSLEPHALMDRRDVVLQTLSEYGNVTIGDDYSVSLDGALLVSANGDTQVDLEIASAGPPPVFEVGGVAVTLPTGRLSAWVESLGIAESMRDRLDLLAVTLADSINTLHNSDLNPAGDTYDIDGQRCDWNFLEATSAADIAVNPLIYDPDNPMDVAPGLVAAAASRFDDGLGTVGPNRGDGTIALQIAELADASLAALNGQGFAEFHTTGLTMLGGMIATETALAEDGDAIVNAVLDAIQQETAVNLDEELMDMVQAQRAFQAAGRLLQTVDEMMMTILEW